MTDDRTPGVEHIATAECWELLQQSAYGRLALVREDGTPDIFPVNHLAHEGSLYVRTARDSKLLHLAHHPVAAFEVDGETDTTRWSVVVRGPAERVTSDAELRDSGVHELHSWSPTRKLFAIKLSAHTVTGRRFAKTEGHVDEARAFQPSSELPVPEPDRDEPHRATRPIEIPHHGPVSSTGPVPVTPPQE